MSIKYCIPEGITRIKYQDLDTDIIPNPKILELTLTSSEVLRVYRVCYLDRGYTYSKNIDAKYPFRNVNIESHSVERERLVKKLIRKVFVEHEHKISPILRMFNLLDDPEPQNYFGSTSINNLDAAKQTYIEYTDWVFHQMKGTSGINKDVKVMSSKRGWYSQDALSYIIATKFDITSNEVKNWADRVIETGAYSLNDDRNFKVSDYSDDDQYTCYALHTELFNQYSEIIVNYFEGKPTKRPIHIKFNGLLNTDLVLLDDARHTWAERSNIAVALSNVWNDDGSLSKSAFEIERNIEATGFSLHKKYTLKNAIKSVSESLIERPYLDGYDIARLANFAQAHFIYCLAYESGANSSQLVNADYTKAVNDPNNKSQRFFQIKARAGYKEVPIRWDIKNFGPVYKRFRALLKVLSAICPEYSGTGVQYFYVNKNMLRNRDRFVFTIRESKKVLSVNSVLWPKDIKWIPIVSIRPIRDINIMESSDNNVSITASMQGRGIETTIKVYLRKLSMNKAALELAPFLKAYRQAAEAHSGQAKARIIENGSRTHAGRCENPDNLIPTKAEELTDNSIDPKCGSPATCFNCKFYALHADVDDIVKVLSLKEWLKYQGKAFSRNIDEFNVKFGALMERADAILADFREQSPEYEKVFQSASHRVVAGEYDPYWENKINAVIDLVD